MVAVFSIGCVLHDYRPLSFLQATLNGLRGEISCLQTQINEHTSAVQTSSLAWRSVTCMFVGLQCDLDVEG